MASPVLAVAGRGEQLVDNSLVGIGRRIVHESLDGRGRRRQASQVKVEAPDKCRPVGRRAEAQTFRFQRREQEGVDGGMDKFRAAYFRQRRPADRLERPMIAFFVAEGVSRWQRSGLLVHGSRPGRSIARARRFALA